MAADIERRYDVRCLPVNCLELGEQEITELLQGLLYEFPLRELDLFLPTWVEALPPDHPIKTGVYQAVRREAADLRPCAAAAGLPVRPAGARGISPPPPSAA